MRRWRQRHAEAPARALWRFVLHTFLLPLPVVVSHLLRCKLAADDRMRHSAAVDLYTSFVAGALQRARRFVWRGAAPAAVAVAVTVAAADGPRRGAKKTTTKRR